MTNVTGNESADKTSKENATITTVTSESTNEDLTEHQVTNVNSDLSRDAKIWENRKNIWLWPSPNTQYKPVTNFELLEI